MDKFTKEALISSGQFIEGAKQAKIFCGRCNATRHFVKALAVVDSFWLQYDCDTQCCGHVYIVIDDKCLQEFADTGVVVLPLNIRMAPEVQAIPIPYPYNQGQPMLPGVAPSPIAPYWGPTWGTSGCPNTYTATTTIDAPVQAIDDMQALIKAASPQLGIGT